MKLLVVTQYFYPENFKCNDMAFELKKRGHDVTVMTAIPNYPKGKFFEGYGLFKKRKETVNGVKVRRSFLVPRGNGSGKRLALNYLSYTFFASLKAVWFSLTKKYDAIIVHEPSPILVGVPAVIIKKFRKTPIHFWVLDLWPESLSAAGGVNNKAILNFFEKLTVWIYKNCDNILIGSKGYRKSINEKGDFNDKITYFPNWVENTLIDSNSIQVPKLPEGFNILIAGNMGDAQDLPHLLEAFSKIENNNVNLIFVGDGRRQSYVEEFAIKNNFEDRIKCMGRYPVESMPSFFKQADVLFMALKDNPIFGLTVPSRLQAYMSSGKPVIAMINGEGADLIKEADCGWTVPAEDSESLAKLIDSLSIMDKTVLSSKGTSGKNYSIRHFDFSKCIDNLEKLLIDKSD